jgi:NAD(P)-dependent dehydrogenase (short-subunit alcohol dehydrogenase family)
VLRRRPGHRHDHRAVGKLNIDGVGALVSGGASGLGLATVKALSARGARVVMFDLPSSDGAAIAAELAGVSFVAGDVREEDDIAAAVAAADELRVAVSCAGVGGTRRIVGREGVIPADFFTRVIDINLVGTFNVLRLAAQRMSEQEPIAGERGVIVNTASIAAFDGQIGQLSYAASKGAIVGMTLPAARDLASLLVRVVTIAPGTFDTPLLARLTPEVRAALGEAVPHPRRLGDPGEYGSLVCHIVENQMLNGEVIRLDGALRMPPR